MLRSPDLAGRVLDGRYELIELIGEGTFGRVYRGRDLRLERAVAVKVIKPWWAEDPVWLERFAREARTLARVSHEGIVQIFDVGQTADSPYYVAELMEGGSLADRLRDGPLPPAEAVAVAQQLSRALGQAHSQQVIHRDVKPANILLGANGRVKVGDFGVARLADGSSHGAAATAIGTPRYMSPEQARGAATGAPSDVYGVGVVMYEMLTGRPPFHGDSAVEVAVRHLNDPPPPLPGSVPRELAAIVERALAKEPGERFPDGAALADALAALPADVLEAAPTQAPAEAAPAELLTDLTSAAPTRVAGAQTAATALAPRRPPPPTTPPTRYRSGRGRPLAAVALLIVIAGAIALVTSGSSSATVPELRGLARADAQKRARGNDLRITFKSRYAGSKKGTVIAQQPRPGKHVRPKSKVRAVVSAGPPPVAVPDVVGRSAADAQSALKSAGLRSHITRAPAPGREPGTVARQSPRGTASAPSGSTVELTVVKQPQWHTLTSFRSTGSGDGRSVPFRIRGERWRVVYDMHYDGSCRLLLVCFGPNADVEKLPAGDRVDSFDVNDGSAKTHELTTGAGVFQVSVGAGDDGASWSMRVQDFY
jgi:serine/threonine-protein kinase